MANLNSAIETINEIRDRVPAERAALIALTGIDASGKGYLTGKIVETLQQRGLRLVDRVPRAGARGTMIDAATMVTSFPCRFTSATPRGTAPSVSSTWPRTPCMRAWSMKMVGFSLSSATVFISPRASAGAPGATTCRPGALQNMDCGACECWTPPAPLIAVSMWNTTGAVTACIVVSLLTPPISEEKLNRFYTLTRTPVKEGEVLVESCALPEGVQPAERQMLTTAFGLEIPKPSRTSVVGFLAGWVAVAFMILSFVWIVH
jgi:hypothetical protein